MGLEGEVRDVVSAGDESELPEIIDACHGNPAETFLAVRSLYHAEDIERVGPGVYREPTSPAAKSEFQWQSDLATE